MNARYVAMPAPKAWSSEQWAFQDRPTMTAIESDPSPKPTGLLDATGVPLYRVEERVALGFALGGGKP